MEDSSNGSRHLEPRPDSENELNVAGISAGSAGEICSLSELSSPRDANVGSELSPDLVSEAKPNIQIR